MKKGTGFIFCIFLAIVTAKDNYQGHFKTFIVLACSQFIFEITMYW